MLAPVEDVLEEADPKEVLDMSVLVLEDIVAGMVLVGLSVSVWLADVAGKLGVLLEDIAVSVPLLEITRKADIVLVI